MIVPIISDASTYTLFWTRAVEGLTVVAVVLLAPLYWLLYRIWRGLRS